jgi:transposase
MEYRKMKPPTTTTCKVCGEQHKIEQYRSVQFYGCPKTGRIYLVPKEGKK